MSSPHSSSRHRWRALAGTAGAIALGITTVLTPVGAMAADSLGNPSDYGVASPDATFKPAANSPTGAWFVQLSGKPGARGGNAKANSNEAKALQSTARGLGVDMKVRQTYQNAWNGVAVSMSDDDANVIAGAKGVTAVYPVLRFDAPEPASGEKPDMASALTMTGADVVQSELGFDGTGVKVGIIDSGIDYDHPDLGGTGADGGAFPTSRVVTGWDFVGDDYNADAADPNYQPTPQPDAVPDDCGGHGTHVAGIVGANGDPAEDGVRGVAPGVTFGAYRVFGCEGSTTADVMLAAMERALDDGMDVVNMSIGSAFSIWPSYPTAVAGDNLVAAGVTVVASIGNSGASGLWAAGAPGVGKNVIGVASFDNLVEKAPSVLLGGEAPAGYAHATGSPTPPTSGSLPLAAAGAPGSPEGTACAPLADFTGKAVLIQRGLAASTPECDASFYAKALAAQNAGASAAVIYNNVPGLLNPTVEGEVEITIPVIFIGLEDGLAAVDAADAADAADATLTWTDGLVEVAVPNAGLISEFSSYGLAADLSVKPDLGAPGGAIWSTLPLDQGAYGTNSGTSMASPHVAGAAALALEANPTLTPAQIRTAFQNTASARPFSLAPTIGLLDSVARQGAGLLQVDDAILTKTTITPSRLAFGESEAGPGTATLQLTNTGDEDVTYAISSDSALSVSENPEAGSADDPGLLYGDEVVTAPRTVTVPANGTAKVDIRVEMGPDATAQTIYSGYILFTDGDGAQLSVPYAGYVGDYQELPVLTPGPYGMPQLGQLTACERVIDVDCAMGGEYDFASAGHVYSMKDGDVPMILTHLERPAQSLKVDIYTANADGTKGKPVHPKFYNAFTQNEIGRSGAPGAFVPLTWDGTRPHSNGNKGKVKVVPDGDYVLVLTVVKPLGQASIADDVETWTSPMFTVDRKAGGN